ncbi:chromophore lyase CpcT/CpeT [Alkalinema sp. FACHB-956]|uniref:chromophore lyase CpcT/CpeT n=1 Tax=Alkalinema sp. FACHB-956 TaxID=2692768 RepID=UPI001686B7AC|nr:chromophore lyase CpcT/CpeT [Alkalinema sp. FACHB-956]MBD2326501.1 chromophore lyase CpcT/CpeT [Alkalinema sp. FACHB-956]
MPSYLTNDVRSNCITSLRFASSWLGLVGEIVAIGLLPGLLPSASWANSLSPVKPPTPSVEQLSVQQQVEAVAYHLTGVMSTTAQSQANPKAVDVTMTTCTMQVAGRSAPNTIYLYQEQALSKSLHQPYRQRFLQLSPSPYSRTIRSLAYKPQQIDRWINFCQKAKADRQIQSADLGEAICAVFLKPMTASFARGDLRDRAGFDRVEFVGTTPVDGCATNVRGATRIRNQVTLHSAGMDTWDRGYDAQGKQVWGAQGTAYQYRWVQKGDLQ